MTESETKNKTTSIGENGSRRDTLSAGEAIRTAREVVGELTGKQVEAISALNRSDEGGWTVCLDVIELVRVPSSTDLLATYEVCLDEGGGLIDMERRRRFTRNQVDEE